MKRKLNPFSGLVFGLLCLQTTIADVAHCANAYPFDDWVCTRDSQNLCQGYYLESTPPFPGGSPEFLAQQPITISADRGQFLSEGDSTLTGHVHLIQGNRQLYADHATIHREAQNGEIDFVQAEGNVQLTEPGLRLEGSQAEFNVSEDIQTLEDVNFRLYERHARGAAQCATVRNRNRLILKDASYTTCAPFQNTWVLRAQNVDLNKVSGRGRARHARLYVKDIPIFYVPYIDFPIDDRRETGFLYPSFGTTNQSGFEMDAPFYWNIAPNYDATFTPRFLSKRGVDLRGQFRYLTGHSRGELQASILPNDRAYQAFRQEHLLYHPLLPNNDPRVTALNKQDSRKSFLFKDNTYLNPNWSSNIQYQSVSDDNYFMDLSNTLGAADTTQLLQQAELVYQDPFWNAKARLQQYQTLHPYDGPVTLDVYRRLPELVLQNYYSELPCGLEFKSNGNFTRFLHQPDPFTGSAFTTGDRFYLRPSLALPMVTPGWYIKPRIQLNAIAYSLSLSPADKQIHLPQNPGLVIPMFDLDAGLVFERDLLMFKNPYIQTLEPRAYYLFVPFQNQNKFPNFDTANTGFDYNQLYRDNRFNGLDRLGDANQITLGVTSRLLKPRTGVERASISVGEIVYFENRKVTACNPLINPLCVKQENPFRTDPLSSLAGTAAYHLQESWTASAYVEWNPEQKQVEKNSFNLQYHPTPLNVMNLGYQYLRHNIARIDPLTGLPERLKQTDASAAWELTEQWRVLSRWHYDIQYQRTNDLLLGIEQQGCCTAVRLSLTRYLLPNVGVNSPNPNTTNKYANAVFIQFVFKGFAGVGHKMTPILKKAIPGYEWRGEEF